MKLAFGLFKYFPYSGLARDCLRVVQECQRRGHAVQVYVADWQEARPAGIPITQLAAHGWSNQARNTCFAAQFRQCIGAQRFDAVVGFNKMPGLDLYYAADSCYVDRSASRHAGWYRMTPRYRHFQAFERAVYGWDSSTVILALSAREKAIYQRHYGTPESRFRPLPPSLDTRFKASAAVDRTHLRQQLGIEAGQNLVLFVGSGFRAKGLDRAIKAVAALDAATRGRTKLYVLGQDNPRRFEKLAQRYRVQDNLHFLGGRHDVVAIMQAGDLMLHPAYNENTGSVLLEAVAAGLPVLTTDVCGYALHITQANAGVVLRSPFQQAELNTKLHAMLDAEQQARWRQNGLAYAQNPDLYRMPQTVADLIEAQVVANRQKPAVTTAAAADAAYWVRDDFAAELGARPDFARVKALPGQPVRVAPARRCLRFHLGGRDYYAKIHFGVGWAEILKNLLGGRWPVLGAKNEWQGVLHLNRLGIDTLSVAAYAAGGGNPARRRSFIITDAIQACLSLEDLSTQWRRQSGLSQDEIGFKRGLIRRVAEISRALHHSGANHRDYYLCHFLLRRGYTDGRLDSQKSTLYVIDLHRMQLHAPRPAPWRWRVKDIAGLYFSSHDLRLTQRDHLRFMQVYRSMSVRETLSHDARFWQQVQQRGANLLAAETRRQLRRTPAAAQTL